jgi:hypothetical protein
VSASLDSTNLGMIASPCSLACGPWPLLLSPMLPPGTPAPQVLMTRPMFENLILSKRAGRLARPSDFENASSGTTSEGEDS